MNRRDFVRSTAFAGGGVSIASVLQAEEMGVSRFPSKNQMLRWNIHSSGSFDLIGSSISLHGCWPSFDGQPLAAKNVKITTNQTGGVIIYVLEKGMLQLTLSQDAAGCTIDSLIKGTGIASHMVYPLAAAQVIGADRFFKQGLGFAGPSGLFSIKKGGIKPWDVIIKEEAWSYDSFMTFALVGPEENTIAFGAYQHDKFINRHTVYNRTHRRGLNDYGTTHESVFLESGFATENIPVSAAGLKLPTLHILGGASAYDTLHRLASNMATTSHGRTHQPPKYHFCSWLEYYEDYDAEKLADLLDGLESIKPPLKIQTIQLDGGYCLAGDWLDPDVSQYPNGLKAAFRSILDAGFHAGIWIAPFAVSSHSRLFATHREWLLHDNAGNLVSGSKGKPFLDSKSVYDEIYYLDTSHPEAMAYLKNVFRTLKAWGVNYFKTDFMDWGLRDSTEVKRHVPGKTSAEYYTDLMKEIRYEIGEESFWLGCISPFGQMVGFVDGMRVSNDAGTEWSVGSTVNMIQESHACQYFNNVLWQNDPDIITFRNSTLVKLTDEEVFSIAIWSSISGSIITTSDRFHKLSKNRRNLLRFIEPDLKDKLTGQLPFWSKGRELIVCVRSFDTETAWAVFVFNTTEAPITYTHTIKELIGVRSVYAFRWTVGKHEPLGEAERVAGTLNPHQSALYLLSTSNAAPSDMGLHGKRVQLE